jgi:hypothetical protein
VSQQGEGTKERWEPVQILTGSLGTLQGPPPQRSPRSQCGQNVSSPLPSKVTEGQKSLGCRREALGFPGLEVRPWKAAIPGTPESDDSAPRQGDRNAYCSARA